MMDVAEYTGISGVAGSLTELVVLYLAKIFRIFGVTIAMVENLLSDKELYPL